jgi:hypothetical protein
MRWCSVLGWTKASVTDPSSISAKIWLCALLVGPRLRQLAAGSHPRHGQLQLHAPRSLRINIDPSQYLPVRCTSSPRLNGGGIGADGRPRPLRRVGGGAHFTAAALHMYDATPGAHTMRSSLTPVGSKCLRSAKLRTKPGLEP